MLLAGRFLVPRASLLALPDGPLAGLDLATGDLVGLAFGPNGDDAEALAARIDRWNALGLPGCPHVRELRLHLGRPLVAYDPVRPWPLAELSGAGSRHVLAGCAALGDVLDAAQLGLPAGPADLLLGRGAPLLRRPAIYPHEPGRPLAVALAEAASRVVRRVPPSDVPPATAERRRAGALVRRLPGSRRARLALVVACGLLSAILASGLARPTREAPAARAALPRAAPAALGIATPARRRVEARVSHPAISRGGPARVLLLERSVERRAPAAAPVRPATALPPAVAHAPGWVDGLFVGS